MLEKVTDIKSAYKFVKDGWAMVKKYGWYNRTVRPYSWDVKVTKILHEVADYGKCTKCSQSYLNSLANGLVEIMNAWEEYELEDEVMVELTTGEVKTVKRSVADLFIGAGTAREVV